MYFKHQLKLKYDYLGVEDLLMNATFSLKMDPFGTNMRRLKKKCQTQKLLTKTTKQVSTDYSTGFVFQNTQTLITFSVSGKYLCPKIFASEALITSSVGNICCENVLLPHHRCNSISALLCEVNLSPAIYFTFKKLFVVSHFTAL